MSFDSKVSFCWTKCRRLGIRQWFHLAVTREHLRSFCPLQRLRGGSRIFQLATKPKNWKSSHLSISYEWLDIASPRLSLRPFCLLLPLGRKIGAISFNKQNYVQEQVQTFPIPHPSTWNLIIDKYLNLSCVLDPAVYQPHQKHGSLSHLLISVSLLDARPHLYSAGCGFCLWVCMFRLFSRGMSQSSADVLL